MDNGDLSGPPADCSFYHSMTLPSGEVKGQWDLRPAVAAYLGGVAFAGRSVLEIGPASGFLSFHMEAAGAAVTCIEPSMERLWDIVPLAGFDVESWRAEFQQHIVAIRKGFWYLHALHRSTVRVVEAEPYRLPADLGRFDIGVLTSVLLHSRSPFDLLRSVARHVTDTLLVAEVHDAALGDEPLCRFRPHPGVPQVHTWWQFTPQFFVSALGVLGFPIAEVGFHQQRSETLDADVPMFTVVARRG
jgi:hypothetical protein